MVNINTNHRVARLKGRQLAGGERPRRILLAMLGSTLGSTARRAKRRISYILREEEGRHRSGVNSLCLSKRGDLLFSAGRDGTARCWSTASPQGKCVKVYDQHTDWVNDLVLMDDETRLVTGSSDTSIKVWNTDTQECISTLCLHTDYVKALAVARQKGFVASAGLDKDVYIWDIEGSSNPVSRSPGGAGSGGGRAPVKCQGHNDSIYSVATNSAGSLVVSGSIESTSSSMGLIRLWDPRTGERAGRLKGHTDNIRALLLSEDGATCISSGSDATIRVWDVGQQRCLQTIALHTDSVWALAASDDFSQIFSGGRDNSVYLTELKKSESTLLFQTDEKAPPLSLALQAGDAQNLWVSTTSSRIDCWSYGEPFAKDRAMRTAERPSIHVTPTLQRRSTGIAGAAKGGLGASSPQSPLLSAMQAPDISAVPLMTDRTFSIPGLPGIVKFDFLENRRHVLTKNNEGGVWLWDVTSGKMIKDFGVRDFDDTRKALEEKLVVPAWCSADCKLGSLAVNLDFPQVFAAELYATDSGHPTYEDPDAKINVGFRVVRSLLRRWRKGRAQMQIENGVAEEDRMEEDLGPELDYKLSEGLRVIVSESNTGVCLCARRVGEFNGSEDPGMLPEWAVHSIELCIPANQVGESIPDTPKVGFHLLKDPNCEIKQMQQGKLNAPQILRARKVLAYAVQRLSLEVPENMVVDGRTDAAEYLELLCNDKVVPLDMNLVTMRRYYGKGSDDLNLFYRWREGGAMPLKSSDAENYRVVGNV